MKKLFASISIIFSIFALSQEKTASKGLRVVNKTKCTQFFVLEWRYNCQCDFSVGKRGTSDIIEIAPRIYTDVVVSDQSIPEQTYITLAKVGGNYDCNVPVSMGRPCSDQPLTYLYMLYMRDNQECKECTVTLATWIPRRLR